MADLRQLNIQYVPKEDRVLLRIRFDDNEVSLWLTRRYCKLLLSVLETLTNGNAQQQAADGPKEKTIKAFQREAATSNADFATPYQESTNTHPLGDKPVVAHQIEYNRINDQQIRLTFGAETGEKINLHLNQALLHTLNKLLLMGVEKADWEISDNIQPLPAPHTIQSEPLH
ncbi:MAG: hypothetical protein MI754_01700 [Chromatiales bacterium]|nr:hypothetical protein [Chromatiales bacterium]